jgi:hypothetical protein
MSLHFKPLLALGFIAVLSSSSAVLADNSCTASIGAKDAKVLAEQCRQISPATNPPCNPQNSCDMIKEEITRGCDMAKSMGGQVPKFCLTASAPQAAPTAPAATNSSNKPDVIGFQSPSKNILCIFSNQVENSGGGNVACQISQFTPSFDKAYALSRDPENKSCVPSELNLYEISLNSQAGQNSCGIIDLAQTMLDEPSKFSTLPYGSNFQKFGITCLSEPTGVTCKNAAGHGFSLSKAKQQIF